MPQKTRYIIKTLSRTKRKDYENYVINSIWNKLNNNLIKPVTQQYFFNRKTGEKGFIDLYFPQLNIGIEVDEMYHSDIGQINKDKNRKLTIFEYLNKIELGKEYKEYRIRVYDSLGKLKSFDDLNDDINKIVNIIKEKINSVELTPWIIDVKEFVKFKNRLTVNDDVIFATRNDVTTNLFDKDSKGLRFGLIANHLWDKEHKYAKIDLWFPKLAIQKENEFISVSNNWNNQVDLDGNIIEFQENSDIVIDSDFYEDVIGTENSRYVFMKSKDIFGNDGYKFIGKYQKTHVFAKEHNGVFKKASFFKRIGTDLNFKR